MKRILLTAVLSLAACMPALSAEPAASVEPPASPALQAFKKAIRAKYDLKEKAWAAQEYEGLVKGF